MNWKINTLEYTNDNDKGVVTAHWDVTLTETVGEGDEAKTYSARRYGSASFQPLPEGSDYVPFEDLTESTVIGWVQSTLDVEEIENSLLAQIEEQKNPKQLKGLPW
jgi:hypothetical protein